MEAAAGRKEKYKKILKKAENTEKDCNMNRTRDTPKPC